MFDLILDTISEIARFNIRTRDGFYRYFEKNYPYAQEIYSYLGWKNSIFKNDGSRYRKHIQKYTACCKEVYDSKVSDFVFTLYSLADLLVFASLIFLKKLLESPQYLMSIAVCLHNNIIDSLKAVFKDYIDDLEAVKQIMLFIKLIMVVIYFVFFERLLCFFIIGDYVELVWLIDITNVINYNILDLAWLDDSLLCDYSLDFIDRVEV